MPESVPPVPPAPATCPGFRARLTPSRSLSRTGFLVVMLVLGVTSFTAGAVFLAMGAWPVFGFFGLDVLLVYWAFRVNYRDGRAVELIEIDGSVLTITRVCAAGRIEIETFNPYWVRVLTGRDRSGRWDLRLASHGRQTRIGTFLSEEERSDLRRALEAALSACRAGSGQSDAVMPPST